MLDCLKDLLNYIGCIRNIFFIYCFFLSLFVESLFVNLYSCGNLVIYNNDER